MQMKYFRNNNLFHTDFDQAWQARQAKDQALPANTGAGTIRQGLDTAVVAIGQGIHETGKARNFFIKYRFNSFQCHIPLGQACTTAGNDDINAAYPFMQMPCNFLPVVTDDLIIHYLMTGMGQGRLNHQAVRVI